MLEEVASIGRAAADEAAKIATVEGQGPIAKRAQDSLAVVEHPLENAPEEEVVVEGKIPLQTMDPLPSSRIIMGTSPPPLNQLAQVLEQSRTRAPAHL